MITIDHQSNSYILNADEVTIGNADQDIIIIDSEMTVRDDLNSKGLVYDGDYSANYTTRSIVDKAYVDNAVSASSGVNPTVLLDFTESTNTGNVTNNIMSPSMVIPGGTYAAGNIMHIRVAVGATNGAAAQTIRLYFNTSHSVS